MFSQSQISRHFWTFRAPPLKAANKRFNVVHAAFSASFKEDHGSAVKVSALVAPSGYP
ncbi:MAG: hypothetical protein IT479_02905 [Xanthomonadales bacterium]|nr:hypothetical protein [Xanthomonadales bacterium]